MLFVLRHARVCARVYDVNPIIYMNINVSVRARANSARSWAGVVVVIIIVVVQTVRF